MYEVGRLDRIINIENIELSEPKIVGDDVDLKAHCLATTFHALKAKPPPSASAAAPPPPPPPAAGGTKP
jgi:type IV pilus assembly protein PilO